MRKKIIPILFITISLIIAVIACKTYAIEWQEKYNVKLEYKIETNNGKKQVVIPVTIENINVKGGILACKARIDYDQRAFESIEIKGTEKWTDTYVLENKVMSSKKIGEKPEKTETPFVIYLTLRDKLNVSTADVTITKLSVGNAVNQEKVDKEYTISMRFNNNDIIMKTIRIIISVIIIIALVVASYLFIIKPKLDKKANINT